MVSLRYRNTNIQPATKVWFCTGTDIGLSSCSTPLLRLTQVVHGYLDRAVPGLAPINRAMPGLGPINILALLVLPYRPLLQGINTVTQARRTILDI